MVKKSGLPPCLSGFEHINRYWDETQQTFVAKILPGQFYVSQEDELITTVLGSCVSCCVRDPNIGVGGMNHFMLPSKTSFDPKKDILSDAARYGNVAMEFLINAILKEGGKRRNLEAKIFGGGAVLSQMTDIGKKNIDFVLQYIYDENLNVVAQDLGDVFPRKVQYFPASGRARVKKLVTVHNDTIVRREREYLASLSTRPVAGDIELF